jgi:uncharacterized membrane protein
MSENRRSIFRTGPLEANRVEAFSDGVLAVIITLLVLDIKIPPGHRSEAELWQAIAALLPILIAWVVSFAFILTFWVNHHYFFSSLEKVDRGLLWLNGLFLLCVALIPFPTALVGEYPGQTPPLALLSTVMMLTALSFSSMRYYASFHAGLIREAAHPPRAKSAMTQSLAAPMLYALAIGMSFVWPPGAILIQVGVMLLFFFRSPGHHHAPA